MGGRELQYVQQAFETNWLSTSGPNLQALESEFEAAVGLPSVAVVNGTAGLHLALRLLGVQRGDEVLVPTFTFVASCNPILYLGATPVFLDSERASWNLDPNRLADFLKAKAASNRLPKALVVVHLFGQSADLAAIMAICDRYELPVVEDAAEALGSRYRGSPVGTFGAVGVFSLNGNKIITSTGGGLLVSSRRDWVDKARHWANQAADPDPSKNYSHSELGYNYRLSNVLAGIARGQLELLEQRVQERRRVFDRYRQAFSKLPGLAPQPEADYDRQIDGQVDRADRPVSPPAAALDSQLAKNKGGSRHTRWLSCFLVDEREFGASAGALIRFLDRSNIEARPVWKPMHMQPLYEGYECVGGEVAEDLNRKGLCLPSSSCLSEEEQQFVIERVREAHERRAD
ncbi:MAG: DegT/DnrJ/EryC1/StrS family aminotransferase [Verrucomicrobiota bacterium]